MAEATPAPAATPVTPPPATPPAEAGTPPADGGAPAAAPPEEGPKRQPWFQARIDAVTREKWEEKRRADGLQAELAQLRAAAPAPAPGTTPPATPAATPGMVPHADVDRLVNERAQALAAQTDFNSRCNTTFQQGVRDITGFQAAVDNLKMLGMGENRQFLDAVTMLPDGIGAQVLAHLGQNMDEAGRILAIANPIQQALEVSRLSATLKKGPGVSQAPAPVQPTTGGAAAPQPGPDADGKFKSFADYKAWKAKNWK